MQLKRVVFLLFYSFILIACVPKINKIDSLNEVEISNELKSFNTNNNDELSIKWWEYFQDTQLNFIVDKALNESFSLKIIEQKYDKANSVIKSIEAENLPSISFESDITRERFSANHIFPAPLGGGIFTEYHSVIALNYKIEE